jgi:hypothetical protein
MQTEQIVALLIAERDRLNRAIEALQGPTVRLGRPPKSATPAAESAPTPAKKTRKKRTFTAEQRAAQAEKMKQFWAKKRKAAKKA